MENRLGGGMIEGHSTSEFWIQSRSVSEFSYAYSEIGRDKAGFKHSFLSIRYWLQGHFLGRKRKGELSWNCNWLCLIAASGDGWVFSVERVIVVFLFALKSEVNDIYFVLVNFSWFVSVFFLHGFWLEILLVINYVWTTCGWELKEHHLVYLLALITLCISH